MATAACAPWALPLVALAVLAWLEDRVGDVARAAVPLGLALAAAAGLEGVALPGAPLAGPGALAAFTLAAYGWRGMAGLVLLAACAAARVGAGGGLTLLVGAGAGVALGFGAWGAAVRLSPDGHLARRRRTRRLDRRAKLA